MKLVVMKEKNSADLMGRKLVVRSVEKMVAQWAALRESE